MFAETLFCDLTDKVETSSVFSLYLMRNRASWSRCRRTVIEWNEWKCSRL